MPLKPFLLFSLLLLLFSLATLKTIGQINCVPVFIKEYSASGHVEPKAIKSLTDGSQIIVGRGTSAPASDYDGMVTKIAGDGTFQWSYLIGGSSDDAFTGVTPLNDGSFLLYGSTSSFGHPEGKAWLVHITAAGSVIWSKQLGSSINGTDRMKAVQQFTDGDIIGTLNINDSTSSSNPVVFKMGLDGTIKWAHEFDNGDNDSFTGLGFAGNTIYASGFYTTVSMHAVIVKMNSGDGSLISSETVFRNNNSFNEQITGLEIYNGIISYALWTYQINGVAIISGVVLVQTDLTDKPFFIRYADNASDSFEIIPRRTSDDGFVLLRANISSGLPAVVTKINRYGLADWGNEIGINYQVATFLAIDITPDGGCVSAGYFNNYYGTGNNQMNITKMNSAGETGGCFNSHDGMFTDTLGYNQQIFTWKNDLQINLVLDQIVAPVQSSVTNTINNICAHSYCADKTPLPAGCDKSYRIEYSSDKTTLLRDVVTTLDGGRIAVGDMQGDALMVKYTVNGDVAWAKNFEEFSNNMKFMRVIRSADGNLLVFANNYSVFGQYVNNYTSVIKLDNNGNILWSKDNTRPFTSDEQELLDVTVTPDNGFVIVINDGYGSGYISTYVIRYDANANVVWQKEMKHATAVPLYRSLSCSSDAIFLAYDSYEFSNYDNFGADMLDLKTGQQIWSNRYSTANANMEHINRIFQINDTAYLFVNNFIPDGYFTSTQNSILLKIDKKGNIIKSLVLQGDNILFPATYYQWDISPPTVTMSPSFDFVMANQVLIGNDTTLNVSRFDKNGTKIWSRNFASVKNYTPYNIHSQGTGFIIAGTSSAPNPDNANFLNSFLLKIDSSGQIIPNTTGDCQQTNRPFTNDAATISIIRPAIDGVVDLTGLQTTAGVVLSQNVLVDATAFCNLPVNCNTVSFKQRGTGCSLTDTLVYFLPDAANCDAAATWQFDNTFFKNGIINGDSIQLIPLKAGSSTVIANIEGNCSLTIKNITASIGISAKNVNVGNDTTICNGQSLKINAHSGYASYLWNDNSTDSILSISLTGKYFVTVTDWCGNTGSDTIQVSSSSDSFRIKGDSIKCNNDIVLLIASKGYFNYQWRSSPELQANGDSAFVSPLINTTYFVNAKNKAGCIVSDSLLITVLTSPAIFIGHDTSICNSDSLTLNAGSGFISYKWNTGDSSQIIYAKQKGTYSVSATFNNGCISKDTVQLINLYNNPDLQLGKNIALCIGGTKQIDAGNYSSYLWNDGSTSSSIIVSDTGKYWVSVVDINGCKASDTAWVKTISPLPSDFLPADTTICQYGKLILIPENKFNQYLWNDGTINDSLSINLPGSYSLQVVDSNGCAGADTVSVIQIQCVVDLFVPDAFTPDGNGHNDVFRPLLFGNTAKYKFAVFDRFGRKVFESSIPLKGWDGRINGTAVKSGTYVWYCDYQLDGQPEKLAKGTVVLIR